MTKSPKISVIMPTYKVEKYFKECIESVINQTLCDIEIIPVDDGSPDNCGNIMDEYAKIDSRIKPIHKKSGGYGTAVNAGISAATGEYIAIVETDDVIAKDMYEKLYNHAKKFNLDVCKCNFYEYNSKLTDTSKLKIWKHTHQDITEYPEDRAFKLLEYPKLIIVHPSIWAGIYKKDFLYKNNIFVNSSSGASYQDFPFIVDVLARAERIGVIHEGLYYWRKEPEQDSSTLRSNDKLLIMPDQCEKVKQILKNNNLYNTVIEEINYHFYLANFAFYNRIPKKFKNAYTKKLKELFIDIKKNKNFRFEYFNESEKRFIRKFTQSNLFYFNNTKQNLELSLLGIKIKIKRGV